MIDHDGEGFARHITGTKTIANRQRNRVRSRQGVSMPRAGFVNERGRIAEVHVYCTNPFQSGEVVSSGMYLFLELTVAVAVPEGRSREGVAVPLPRLLLR